MESSVLVTTAATLVAALVLALVYVCGPRFFPEGKENPERGLAMAAGASLAYVFLDVLPELGERHQSFLAAAGDVSYSRQRIYALALLGFVALFGLRELAESIHRRKLRSGDREDGRNPGFWVHIGGFALYGAIIGDALLSRSKHGALHLCLYVVAMVFHLLIISRSLAREHGKHYQSRGRWVLAAGVLAGWLTAIFVPMSDIVMARLFAFVAGGVLLTSASEELPRDHGGVHFGWFVLGAGAYGTLLLFA